MAIVTGREPWFKIDEPPHGFLTDAQEQAIRDYAHQEGFEDLRGVWKWMESKGWDYYNILRITSPRR